MGICNYNIILHIQWKTEYNTQWKCNINFRTVLQASCYVTTIWERHSGWASIPTLFFSKSEGIWGWAKCVAKFVDWLNFFLLPLCVCDYKEPLKHLLSFYLMQTKTAISQPRLNKRDKKILCSCASLPHLFHAALRIAPVGNKQGAAL